MAYQTSYHSTPTPEDQSYVMLVLSMGVLKRSIPQMVVYNTLPEAEEQVMLETGVKLLNGDIDTATYIKKLEDVCQKAVDKAIKFDDYVDAQLAGRLDLSRSSVKKNKGLEQKSGGMVTNVGTMKSMTEAEKLAAYTRLLEKETGKKVVLKKKLVEANDPRFEALPEDDKRFLQGAFEAHGLDPEDVSTQKLNFIIKRLKGLYPRMSAAGRYGVQTLMTTLDPGDWKGFKPEPVVRDMQLNSVELEEEQLEEAKVTMRDKIVNYLKQHPYQTAKQIFQGMSAENPPYGISKMTFTQALGNADVLRTEKIPRQYYLRGQQPAQQVAAKPKEQPLPGKQTDPVHTVNNSAESMVLGVLTSKPGLTFQELLHALGVIPGSAGQIKVFGVMKKDLLSGVIRREKDGPKFKYYVGNGTPGVMQARTPSTKFKSLQDVTDVVNGYWRYEGKWEDGWGNQLTLHTNDRGPRTDHGGPPDGDGWMDYHQIEQAAAPYRAKWLPRLKELAQRLKEKGIKVKGYDVDYGEKGHIALNLEISEETVARKK